ncbi:hypothetical protein E6P09_17390 (plasmid) [Haloferax mediterranei ATCC 33500]|nr:hypothetical protein [Haloferax mediterranei]AFK20928.1 hypothetical protein HFX_5093 [Haloferax mediterranei ATCC 33500]AHZ24203.1 hypothetical protein BM92_18550 [Haloferax mediterranei ATCC 33500]MDX5989916.1 hypothetical protein [Haloferax mediterranei ATCC 33500]QCQ77108.1 hypothetical protein E6P09_17390 [Haloferax mediterranei ATCC 33500]
MNGLIAVVVGMKTATLLLGGLVTFVTFRAYRQRGTSALRSLCLGFALVTTGSLVAGIVHQLMPLSYDHALVVESSLTVAGFAVIAHSLYADDT